jgi:RNA polymerase sigma-70 factor (ECF subfamily)
MTRTRNAEEAEEIVQETFLKVWEIHRQIDPERNFENLLITIAKNKIYSILRHRVIELRYGATKGIEASDTAPANVEHDLYMEDLRKALLKGIDSLSPQQREILTLKSQGLTNDEIAAAMAVPKKTLENNIYKAYRQLRIQLDDFRDVMPLIPALISCLLI